jgi:Mrp family chromosome partitioning ATPase
MSEERRKILNMVAEGKITVAEAEELLAAIGQKAEEPKKEEQRAADKPKPKYLRVVVASGKGGDAADCVNMRIPLQLARAGVKLAAIMPEEARQKVNQAFKDKGMNIDLDDLQSGKLDEILTSLGDCCIDVDGGGEKVRIFCE